jgi:hypothetical protein
MIDGVLKTQVMTKASEPNYFALKEEFMGDQIDRVKREWL